MGIDRCANGTPNQIFKKYPQGDRRRRQGLLMPALRDGYPEVNDPVHRGRQSRSSDHGARVRGQSSVTLGDELIGYKCCGRQTESHQQVDDEAGDITLVRTLTVPRVKQGPGVEYQADEKSHTGDAPRKASHGFAY